MPPLRDIVVLTAVICSLPFCFFRPFYGIQLWIVLAFLNPHRDAWGPARNFPVALLVGTATIAGFLIFERGFQNLWRREMFFLGLLWFWFVVTTVISVRTPIFQHHAQDTLDQLGFVSKILLMVVVSVAIVNNWRRLRWYILAIAGSFGFLLVKMLPWMVMSGGAFRAYGPEGTMIADNNDFGLALNMTLPLFFYLAKTETDRRLKALFWCLTLLTVPAVLFTWSRGAVVGLIAVMGLLLLQAGATQKLLLIPILMLAIGIGVFVTPQKWQQRMMGMTSDPVDASVEGRFNAWGFAWNLAKDYPITGGGFETFTPELFARYAQDSSNLHGPHSIYFGILGDHGFVGLGLYLVLMGSCFLTLGQTARTGKQLGDDRMVNYARMLRASLVGFMVCGAFLGREYFDYYFDIVAAVAMLSTVLRAELDGPRPERFEQESDESYNDFEAIHSQA